jgi:hypothetical protein
VRVSVIWGQRRSDVAGAGAVAVSMTLLVAACSSGAGDTE